MENRERNHEIYVLKNSGMSYTDLSIEFNLSRTRILQICEREEARIKANDEHKLAKTNQTEYSFYDALMDCWIDESERRLAIRVYRCLKRAGIISYMNEHNVDLDVYKDDYLLAIWNFGPASLRMARKANYFYKETRSKNA